MSRSMDGILFGYGNPLLDISAEVNSEFLEKYKLKADDAILADESHKTLYDDLVDNFKVDYVSGGATLNSVRIAQWMIGVPNSTTFLGCIGMDDKYGQKLEEKTKSAGVNPSFQRSKDETTGTCAVLITNKQRSLVAYLAAANKFTKSHLEIESNQVLMNKAEYYYCSNYPKPLNPLIDSHHATPLDQSFPLTVSPESVLSIAEHSSANNKTFCLNLSAPFLCQFFKKQMLDVMPHVDIIFGNESEAASFSQTNEFNTSDIPEIASRIASLPKHNGRLGRIVIITQGSEPTIVCKEGKITYFPVIHISKEDILDTNGAGDAFVGGFLAHLVQNDDMETCIRAANYAANVIIQHSGCTYPEQSSFKSSIF